MATEKHSELEVCPRCATPSRSTYDHRVVANGDSFVVAADGRLGVEDDQGVFRWCRISDGKVVPISVVVRAGSDAPVMNLSEVFQAIRSMPAVKLG